MTVNEDVIEIWVESPYSFEEAIRSGIEQVNRTLQNVSGAWVAERKVRIENGRVAAYQVDMRVTTTEERQAVS